MHIFGFIPQEEREILLARSQRNVAEINLTASLLSVRM
jgi:hypothetical protein